MVHYVYKAESLFSSPAPLSTGFLSGQLKGYSDVLLEYPSAPSPLSIALYA
jgi:hypothetical protein